MAAQVQGVSAPLAFPFNDFSVRAIADSNGEPWFCAKDVCAVLGYRNDSDALAKHCRESGVAKRDLSSGGQVREMTFINEGNLYRLIVKSRKPEAEAFEQWLMEEVLPSIRKTGRYAPVSDSRKLDPIFHVTANELDALVAQRMKDMAIGRNILAGLPRRRLDAEWQELGEIITETQKTEALMERAAQVTQALQELSRELVGNMLLAGDIVGNLRTLRERARDRQGKIVV